MRSAVADAAPMLSIMAGPDALDRTSLDGAPAHSVGELGRDLKGLRVAYSPDLGGLRVDPEVAALVRAGVRAFEELGCVVEEVKPRFADTHEMIRVMWSAHEAGNRAPFLKQWRERMDPGLVACIEDGLRVSLVDYIQMRDRKLAYWDSVRPLVETQALLPTPSVPVPALEAEQLNPPPLPD